jgi:RIO kinase 1
LIKQWPLSVKLLFPTPEPAPELRRKAPVKTPKRIAPLVDEGLVDEVLRQLMSGKEAEVYVVRCGQDVRCAKVYKEASKRSFRQNVQYTEGRKVKNSRRARAMEKGSRYGRQEQEQAWQNAEVDALHRLAAAGVRVPKPYNFLEGVLLMELVTDENGNAAPRLNDLVLSEVQACEYHRTLIMEVVRMLCAGVIHGDLSEYNVLVGSDGPVIIDLPQAVDAAGNNSAGFMLERDVENLTAYFGRFAPDLRTTDYGREIWSIYQSGKLQPQVALTGCFARSEKLADVGGLIREIDEVKKEEAARQRYKQALKQ